MSVSGVSSRRAAVVIGTRPEAIKLAPIVQALHQDPSWEPVVLTTGQHGDVVDDVLDAFGIDADVRHEPWSHAGELATLHTTLVDRINDDLDELDVATVVVQGDTASALAGAMAAFWRQLPVVDVEAGLRSGDLHAPFPEEANRRLITQVSALHLAPTVGARDALATEGIVGEHVVVTGNTVIDALHALHDPSRSPMPRRPSRNDTVLVTCHRRENWGALEEVAAAIHNLATTHKWTDFVVVTHPNPQVQAVFDERLDGFDNVAVTGPMPYPKFISLVATAKVALTDSGGVQEEAPAFGVPVLVMRDVTERPEGVAAGVARLIGTNTDAIVAGTSELLTDQDVHARMAQAVNPYGDGHAARRSVGAMSWLFGNTPRPDEFTFEPGRTRPTRH